MISIPQLSKNFKETIIAKLSQGPAQLSGAKLALFLENPHHPPTPRNSSFEQHLYLPGS